MDHYASGVLKEEVHGRLVLDIDRIAAAAGISPAHISAPVAGILSEVERDWAIPYRRLRDHGVAGLLYVGSFTPSPADRMMNVAGLLLRNFIDAKVMTLSRLIEHCKEGGLGVSCVLVTNFHLGREQSGKVPDWQVAMLYDLLMDRYGAGLQTVLSCSSIERLRADYGTAMGDHLSGHFMFAQGANGVGV